MIGLSGARVLLLDDEPTEALPVIQAFSKTGIPVLYFDGKQFGFPTKKQRLRGIRLAILDMDLGVGGSAANMASTLVQSLSRILSPENGPYGVLVWTNHPDVRDAAARAIFLHETVPNPVFIVELTKAECKVNHKLSLQVLSQRLVKKLTEPSPLDCMQAWEGSCFTAATLVTNTLAELTDIEADGLTSWITEWRQQLLRLLLAISTAKAEQHLSAKNCLPSIFLSMNPLHSDRMDVLTEKIAHEAAAHATSILGILGGPSTTKKAKINSMLHLALHDRRQLAPGNMYIFTEKRPHWMPRLNKILDDCIQGNDAQRQANLDAVSADARLIGVEISPVCDHAQKKLRQSKLLAGFLVSEEHKKRIKTAEFLKSIGPLYLKSKKIAEGVYMIYLNSRYGPTADPAKVGKFSAYGRFRQQVLADIQAWSAYQSARQGVMLLR